MIGRRVYPDQIRELVLGLEPGDYGQDERGVWVCCPPECQNMIGNLSKHTVVEHEDGTITVSPSISISASHLGSWHGFLERGVWRLA